RLKAADLEGDLVTRRAVRGARHGPAAHTHRARRWVRVEGRRAMSPRWPVPSIRLRLTAWYTVVLCLMLVVYATTTFVTVRHEFLEQLVDDLYEDFEAAEGRIIRTPQG